MFLIAPAAVNGQRGFLFDEKAKLRCFHDSGLSAWVIVDTDHPAPVIRKGEDDELPMRAGLYNGKPCWEGYGAVFFSVTDGWIFNPYGIAEPFAEKDVDGETWIGDGWWKLDGEPTGRYPEVECSPKGSFLNEGAEETPPVLRWWWPRWEWRREGSSRAPWGVYDAKDGAAEIAPRRIVGSQQYRDGSRRYWLLSQDRNSLACADGRTIRFNKDEDLWVLGVKGLGKWWQTPDGPSRESGMKLEAWKRDEETDEDVPDPDGKPVELTFYAFVATEGTDRMYVAEAALWR